MLKPRTDRKSVQRFVRLMLAKGASVDCSNESVTVQHQGKSARVAAEVVADLVSQGVLAWKGGVLCATSESRMWLRRQLSASDAAPFAEQHRHIQTIDMTDRLSGEVMRVNRNDNESPLSKLAQLKRSDKSPYILPHHIAAGERLRRDFDQAHLSANLVMNWNAAYSSSSGPNTGGNINDMAIDARARLSTCYGALGGELAGVLIDFCGYLKGLETIELERQWPRRSAKLAIRLALGQLARHYGLDEAAGHQPSAGAARQAQV